MKKNVLVIALAALLILALGACLTSCPPVDDGNIAGDRVADAAEWKQVMENTLAEFAIGKTDANFIQKRSIYVNGDLFNLSSLSFNGNKGKNTITGYEIGEVIVSYTHYVLIDNGWTYGFHDFFESGPYFYCEPFNVDPTEFRTHGEDEILYFFMDRFSWFEFDNGRYNLKQENYSDASEALFALAGGDRLLEFSLVIRNGRITESVFEIEDSWNDEVDIVRYVFSYEFGTVGEIVLPQAFLDAIAESRESE